MSDQPDIRPPHEEPPFNPLPPIAVAMAAVVGLIELVFQLGARGLIGGPGAVSWRRDALLDYGFSDVAFDWMLTLGVWDSDAVMRMFLIRFRALQRGPNAVPDCADPGPWQMGGRALAAVGDPCDLPVLGLCWGGSLRALRQHPRGVGGGIPRAYGLIGAFTFLIWTRLVDTGGPQSQSVLADRVLLGLQLVFGIVTYLTAGAISRDWIADLGGVAAGFLITIPLSPGGITRLKEKIRRR